MRSATLILTIAEGNGKSFQVIIARIRYRNLQLCCHCLYLLFTTSCVACSETLYFLLRDRRIVKKKVNNVCGQATSCAACNQGNFWSLLLSGDKCSASSKCQFVPRDRVFTSLVLFFLFTQISLIKASHGQKLLKFLEKSGSFF